MPLSNVTVSHLSPMVVYWPATGWDEDTVEDSKDDQLLVSSLFRMLYSITVIGICSQGTVLNQLIEPREALRTQVLRSSGTGKEVCTCVLSN